MPAHSSTPTTLTTVSPDLASKGDKHRVFGPRVIVIFLSEHSNLRKGSNKQYILIF